MQCLILDKNAHKVRRALGYTKTIELQKKRGVYWLPVPNDERQKPEPTVLAATRAAKTVVPADAVVPPKDLDQSHLWFLNRAMNGTKILANKKKWGFLEVESVPGLFTMRGGLVHQSVIYLSISARASHGS